MSESLDARLRRVFPGLIFDNDGVDWHKGCFVRGYRGDSLELDGEFTGEQLQALAEWMNTKIEEIQPDVVVP